ncbi:PREDICTED: organic cation transporter protein-like [Rhagoletis zephyria]|uniref:organic cation transporter protein-like n=1 Tax=Rhagoletis zephyria TaxID=28612 RepID=UPI000811A5C1|nr:PREDICTED: organic cation transporter protein-like [Rhagoletis zephyria]
MEKSADKTTRTDPIISLLGSDLGPWQLIICLWIFLSKFPTGWVQVSMVFLQSPIKSSCVVPDNNTDVCAAECKEVAYDRSVFQENIISEWNLICERAWLASLAQSFLMIGIMLGSISFGLLADKWGRRPMFVGACVMDFVFGCLVSASPWFWLFVLLRFLDGFALGATMSTGFTIIMEIVGQSKRETMAILFLIPFNLGHATLPLFAYYIRHWRWYHLSFSALTVFLLLCYWTVPESPRWLFTTGRTGRAVQILEAGCKRNKMPTANIRTELEQAAQLIAATPTSQKGNIIDLFRYPYLCRKTLVMTFNWFVTCLVYFGMSQLISQLSGDIFLNVAISAILGVPGTLICIPMTRILGRRFTLFLSHFCTSIPLLALAFAPSLGTTTRMVVASIGLFAASVSSPNIYLYAGELFPTVVRNSGMGLCSFVGRIGSASAPFLSGMSAEAEWIPLMVFGGFSLVAAASLFLVPETRDLPLPETIEDGETFGNKSKKVQIS